LPQERRAVLDRAAAIMERRKQEIVDWLVRESGSTLRKAELEWQFAHLYMLTRDGERGVRVAKRIRAGMTHVNDWPVDDEPNTAFGGEKASGLGRFGGAWALEEFTTDHWISVQAGPRRYPI
jgi:acyl-CoA reductase-like NAD-dependent aldehyde dehydrogenase